MTDAEYAEYSTAYGEMIVGMVASQLNQLDYKDEVSQMIRVEEDDDGILVINDDDFGTFDTYVIFYP